MMEGAEGILAIEAELRERNLPEHLDDSVKQGIFYGLELAWRIMTDTRDNGFINWNGEHGCVADYPMSRLS